MCSSQPRSRQRFATIMEFLSNYFTTTFFPFIKAEVLEIKAEVLKIKAEVLEIKAEVKERGCARCASSFLLFIQRMLSVRP